MPDTLFEYQYTPLPVPPVMAALRVSFWPFTMLRLSTSVLPCMILMAETAGATVSLQEAVFLAPEGSVAVQLMVVSPGASASK